jgi:phosphoglycolate phosphatase-like HAD superfamily hydrolase
MDSPTRDPAIICDVDGTLCDVRKIRHYVERPAGSQRFRANFALFHSASEACPAFPQVIQLMRTLALDGYVIVVVTAREARWAELTERWLDQHGVQRVELITRRDLDYRPDAVVKAEICAEIQSCYEPLLAVDDRDDILAVWAAASIPTLRVGEAGSLSAIVWPGATPDDQLDAIVNRVRGSAAPSA